MRSFLAANREAASVCFGLNRELDEQSLAVFLQRATSDDLLAVLLPRLEDKEVSAVVDFVSGLMHKHLSKQEYHQLFLND
ncbi:MAG: hypothetical protein OEL55_00460 [Desulfobulbaceae bacterium]|nr:hypothetical protein [Desulfobulbaceae bacterium]